MPKTCSMSFNVKTISVFERQVKRLVKKFPSIKKEIQELIKELKQEPEKGTSIGNNCYKMRLGIASKGKGKSAEPELLFMSFLKTVLFTCFPFTINQNWKNLQTTRYSNLLNRFPCKITKPNLMAGLVVLIAINY